MSISFFSNSGAGMPARCDRSLPADPVAVLRTLALMLPLAAMPLVGAELVVRDIQASVLALPTAFDVEVTTGPLKRSGADAFDSGTALEAGVRVSTTVAGDSFGAVLGLDATASNFTYNGANDALFTYGFQALVGLGYAFNEDWTVSVSGQAGYGLSQLDLPATDLGGQFEADGRYLMLGGRVGVNYQISRHWVVTAGGGYLYSQNDLSTPDSQSDLKIQIHGIFAGLGVSYRFSNDPERLR
jgi:hypothetical protein